MTDGQSEVVVHFPAIYTGRACQRAGVLVHQSSDGDRCRDGSLGSLNCASRLQLLAVVPLSPTDIAVTDVCVCIGTPNVRLSSVAGSVKEGSQLTI